MTRPIETRLQAAFDDYGVVDQIHDVPPHEVYEVRVDGRRAVYKHDVHSRGTAGVEGYVTALVGEQTSVSVPEILQTGTAHYVAAWHPDAPAPDEGQAPDERWLTAAGRGLATLHDETAPLVDSYGYFDVTDGRVTPSGCATWHEAALEYVEYHEPVLTAYGYGNVADDVRRFLRANPDVFEDAGEPVCCHGWVTPEHATTRDGDIACLLDFEHAIAAPAGFDYWRTATVVCGGDEALQQAFREAYESVHPLPPNTERRRDLYGLLNLVYYFESLYIQDQHDSDTTAERARELRTAVTERLETLA
jgi:hypothetical protein